MKPLEEMTLKELKDLCQSFSLSVEGHKGRKDSYIKALLETEDFGLEPLSSPQDDEDEDELESFFEADELEDLKRDEDENLGVSLVVPPELRKDEIYTLEQSLPPDIEIKEGENVFILDLPLGELKGRGKILRKGDKHSLVKINSLMSRPVTLPKINPPLGFFRFPIPDEDSFKWERWIGVKELSLDKNGNIATTNIDLKLLIVVGAKVLITDEKVEKVKAIGEIKTITVVWGSAPTYPLDSWEIKIEKIWVFENPLTIKPLSHVETSGIFEVRLTDRSKSKFPQELAMCEYKKAMDKQYQSVNN